MSGVKAGVRLTAGAEHDLLGIYRRRLAQRGADGAEALLDRLVAGIEGLADHPERGPVPPELEAKVRNAAGGCPEQAIVIDD